jgi:hypothetical protein
MARLFRLSYFVIWLHGNSGQMNFLDELKDIVAAEVAWALAELLKSGLLYCAIQRSCPSKFLMERTMLQRSNLANRLVRLIS